MNKEKILVIPNKNFAHLFPVEKVERINVDPLGFQYLERTDQLEEDTSYIQIIPYVILTDGSKILCYQRSESGDKRLNKQVSVGFGGHINESDNNTQGHIMDVIKSAAKRELMEEIGLSIDTKKLFLIHSIYNKKTPVNSVHLGIVFLYKIHPCLENLNFNKKEIGHYWWDEICNIRKYPREEVEKWTEESVKEIWERRLLEIHRMYCAGMAGGEDAGN